VLHRVQAWRGGEHPAPEGLFRRWRRAARLRARLGVDGQVDDGVLDGLIGRGAFAGAHGEDQALPTHRRADPRFEAQGLGGDLVQRLQHGDVVAGAADRGLDRLLGHLLLRRGGGRHVLGVDRGDDDGRRWRDGGGRSFLGDGADGRRGWRRLGRDRCDRRNRRLGGHHPGQQAAQGQAEAGAAKKMGRGAARAHGYSGVQAS